MSDEPAPTHTHIWTILGGHNDLNERGEQAFPPHQTFVVSCYCGDLQSMSQEEWAAYQADN